MVPFSWTVYASGGVYSSGVMVAMCYWGNVSERNTFKSSTAATMASSAT